MAEAIKSAQTGYLASLSRVRLLSLLLGGVLVLSACAGSPGESAQQTAAEIENRNQRDIVDKEQLAVLQHGLRAPLTTPVPRIEGLSQRIHGMLGDEVVKLLGEPSFRRRDEPAEIWQYRGRRCILDVFIFKTGNLAKVNHVEIRTTSVARPADPDCYADIFGSRPFPRAG